MTEKERQLKSLETKENKRPPNKKNIMKKERKKGRKTLERWGETRNKYIAGLRLQLSFLTATFLRLVLGLIGTSTDATYWLQCGTNLLR